MIRIILLCLPLLLLTACSDDKPVDQKQNEEPNYGIYKYPMDSLEKAKGFEQQLRDKVEEQDQQIREIGG